MAYTPGQIQSLPITDPVLKAKFAAAYGAPASAGQSEALFTPAAPAPEAAPFTPVASAPMPPPAIASAGQPLASGFVVDPRETYVNQAKASGAFLTEDAVIGGIKPPVPPPQIEIAQAEAEVAKRNALPPGAKPPATPSGPALAMPAMPGGPPAPPMGGSGGGLPLQAPVVAEGQYKGFDPNKFGKSPGQLKLDALQGSRLLAEGQFAEQEAGIDARTAEDYSGVAQKVAADADARAAEAEKKAAERKAFLAKYNAETERQINDYANAKIDPARFWAGSQGTGNAIAATIGAFVSGIAGYLDPSKDYVGQFTNRIEQKIQQDIDLQKAEVAKKGQSADMRRGLYANYLQQFGQEDAAEAMAYETYLRKTKAQIDSYASKATSEKAKVQLGALSAALEDRQKMWAANRQAAGESMIDAYYAAQAKAQAAAAAAADKVERDLYEDRRAAVKAKSATTGGIPDVLPPGTVLPNGMRAGKFGMPVLRDANGNIVDYGTEVAKTKAEGGGGAGSMVTVVTGFNAEGKPKYGQAPATSKEAAKAFTEGQKAYTQLKQDITALKALRAKHNGGALFSAEDTARGKAIAKRIQITLKGPAFANLGALSGSDLALLEDQIPGDPMAPKLVGVFGSDPIGVQLEESEKAIDSVYQNAEATYLKGGAAKQSALPLEKAK